MFVASDLHARGIWRRFLCLLLLGLGYLGSAQAAQLLRDINTSVEQASSSPHQFALMGDIAFFVAQDDDHGAELWRSDGSEAGTYLLADIRPGPDTSYPEDLVVVNGTLYFSADDGVNGRELWRSDGTIAGTYMLADIAPGSASGFVGTTVNITNGPLFQLITISSLYPIVASGPYVYFIASDGVTGAELWRTNGMLAGTIRLTQLAAAGASTTSIKHMTAFGSHLAFTASDASAGEELWITDGTPGGTSRVTDINPGTGGSYPDQLTVAANQLFFTATDGQHGRELWHSDGTAGGTHMVADLTAGAADTLISDLTSTGEQVFFAANSSLWRSDGTPAGTIALSNSQTPKYLSAFGHRIVYRTGDAFVNSTAELWISDGTVAGTTRLFQSSTPDNYNRRASAPLIAGNHFYFMDQTDADGLGIWASDGTSSGTVAVDTVVPPPNSTSDANLLRARLAGASGNGVVYFIDTDAQYMIQLWRTDGTPGGTFELGSVVGVTQSGGATPVATGQTVAYFTPYSSTIGTELSITDGTVAGTRTVKDIAQSHINGSSSPLDFTLMGNAVLFTATPADNAPAQLWSTDGTSAGTQMLVDVSAGSTTGGISQLVKLGSKALLTATTPAAGNELWITDGTVAGTQLVKDLVPGPDGSNPWLDGGTLLNSSLIFPTTTGSGTVASIWATDGTPGGTVLLKAAPPNTFGPFLTAGVYAYFPLPNTNSGNVLWKTDGTPGGTQTALPATMTFDSIAGSAGGYLFFGASDNGGGLQLWRTDGTAAGTIPLTNLSLGTGAISRGTALGSRLIFTICPFSGTCGIYASDGSANGTVRLADGSLQYYLRGYAVVSGNQLYFSGVRPGQSQPEIWVTDGTPGGTHPVDPGNAAGLSYPNNFVSFAGVVLCTVNSPKYGGAIFRTDGSPQGTWLVATGPLFPGPFSAQMPNPPGFAANALTAIGNRVYFNGANWSSGSEPFVLNATDPVANDDRYIISPPALTHLEVLENDGIVTGAIDPATVSIVSTPTFGTATVDSSTGQIVYTPHVVVGRDSLTYTVRSASGAVSNTARVDVIIGGADGGTVPASGTGSGGTGGTGAGGTGTGGTGTGGTGTGGTAGSGDAGSEGGKGGGGAFGFAELLLLSLLGWSSRRPSRATRAF
ncbi:MAG: hypothetical protein JSR66_01120 [Proteobacteria bacterium]|nr:hypothetical protein [Pseudomonadota bacterium]